jgi:hypothetical protein
MPEPREIPQTPDHPDEGTTSVVVLNMGGKRYEIRTNVEVREVTRGPAEVIQFPASEKGSIGTSLPSTE